jgi:hypothetical protein
MSFPQGFWSSCLAQLQNEIHPKPALIRAKSFAKLHSGGKTEDSLGAQLWQKQLKS